MDNAIEAIADAWASIDGNLEDFRAGKGKDELAHGGRYGGYMADAESLAERIQQRGYAIHKIED